MRKQMAAYIQQVRDSEWEPMAHGRSDRGAEAELQHLGQALFGAEGRCPHHALYLVTTIHDSRNERLDSPDGSVPTALWLVLLAGALITLGYASFFGTSNLMAQNLMPASIAALVALTAFVAIVLDFPFTGRCKSRAPPEQSLQEMSQQEPPP